MVVCGPARHHHLPHVDTSNTLPPAGVVMFGNDAGILHGQRSR